MRESERDFNAASAAIMEQHVGAAPVVSDPMLAGLRGVIATSAARHAIAIVYGGGSSLRLADQSATAAASPGCVAKSAFTAGYFQGGETSRSRSVTSVQG